MLSPKQEKALLASPLFEGCAELPEGYARLLEAQSFESGESVCPPEGGAAAGVVVSGRAAARGESGVALNRFERGGLFGVASLFGGDGYVSSVIAETRCETVFFSTRMLETLFRERSDLALGYIRFLSGRIRFLNAKISAFTAPTAAETLMVWARRSAVDGAAEAERGWSALARSLGIGRASLYRALDELESAGRIVRDGDRRVLLRESCAPADSIQGKE